MRGTDHIAVSGKIFIAFLSPYDTYVIVMGMKFFESLDRWWRLLKESVVHSSLYELKTKQILYDRYMVFFVNGKDLPAFVRVCYQPETADLYVKRCAFAIFHVRIQLKCDGTR